MSEESHSSEEQEVRELLQETPSETPGTLPLLILDSYVLFPFMIAPVIVQDDESRRLVDHAVREQRILGAFARLPQAESAGGAEPAGFARIPRIGVAAAVLKLLRMPDNSLRLLLHGMGRVRITREVSSDPFMLAEVEPVNDLSVSDNETQAMMKNAQAMLADVVKLSNLPDDLSVAASSLKDPGKLGDLIASNLSIEMREQQAILEMADVKQRLRRVLEILNREKQVLEIGSRIQSEVKSRMSKNQRDYVLREQLRAIRRELGEEEEGTPELESLRKAIETAGLPPHGREAADKELSRLQMMNPAAAEYAVSRNYLDWILSLPWSKGTRDRVDMRRAQKVLDEDHYDLEKVKERILEYLAVIKLRKSLKGPILCLVGPPGVGKTSLGKSIARALQRKFWRISLGGMRDEAEIRGHRRTYIGALPGRILTALKSCGSNNPVIMLDEIDKVGSDFRGDPASALLEVLDPEQNYSFTDHYLDLAFDLSKIMFITTANILDTIPGPLLDRMEVLRLAGYTFGEKLQIAKRYLIPRAYEATGVTAKDIVFEDGAVERIADEYTREAGLRNLERELINVCRKVARKAASKEKTGIRLTTALVPEYLGPPRHYAEVADRPLVPGISIGLAWTPVGGEILFIEASTSAGKGGLTLTGQLGDVMKESATAALSYLRAQGKRFGIAADAFSKNDIHIHIPAGAIPKDGPSAGVAICTALVSLLTRRTLRERVAMTGEITLTGNVLPIGGLKEKSLAAHRAGIREIFIPKRNEKDMDEIPKEVRDAIKFDLVERVEEILETAFNGAGKAGKKARAGKAIAQISKGRLGGRAR